MKNLQKPVLARVAGVFPEASFHTLLVQGPSTSKTKLGASKKSV
jgi:hypothetical protein